MRPKTIGIFESKPNPDYEEFYRKSPLDLQMRIPCPRRLEEIEVKIRQNIKL